MDAADPRPAIRARALQLGFDAVGFAPARLADNARDRLRAFLDAGLHGDMGWLAERTDQRSDPQALWPAARSVICLGVSYAPEQDPLAALARPERGNVSVYARGRDYHDVVKGMLKHLAQYVASRHRAEVKVFTDTAPVMEKPLAQRAGLGWQGKHTNLVSRDFGSWLFLGSILTTLEIAPDQASVDHCSACHACLDICPTNAFPAPYQLDARRCISYLTIEHAGPIPLEFRRALGNRIYGCDDCLAVCPWNKFAGVAREAGLHARDELRSPPLEALATLDDAAFRAMFSASPIKRIGRDRFVRNVLYAIGNSGDAALKPAAATLLNDTSETVRDAAQWALTQSAGHN